MAPQSSDELTSAPGEMKFAIVEKQGDLLRAPGKPILIHATNCLGSWGAGIAKQFKEECPEAYRVYHEHCTQALSPDDLVGTCLIIQPQSHQKPQSPKPSSSPPAKKRRKTAASSTSNHDTKGNNEPLIACLFTSQGYGKRKTARNPGVSKASDIVRYTKTALEDMKTQLEIMEADEAEDKNPFELCSCKFNSGFFGVDWSETKAVINEVFVTKDGHEGRQWTVYSP